MLREASSPKGFGSWLRVRVVDLPLHQDTSARFVPWMVGVMLYLVLLLGFIFCLVFGDALHEKRPHDPHLTLEVGLQGAQAGLPRDRVLGILRETPEIDRFDLVPQEAVERSFLDFFEEPLQAIAQENEIPFLIDVWLKKEAGGKISEVRQKLRRLIPNLQIFVYHAPPPPLFEVVNWMTWGLLAGVGFLLIGLGVVVAFAVRTGISIHGPVLEILDLMGASSSYITRQFQIQTWKNTRKSIGVAFCLLLLSFVGGAFFLEDIGAFSRLILQPALPLYGLFVMLVTVFAVGLMWGVTRGVVRGALAATC